MSPVLKERVIYQSRFNFGGLIKFKTPFSSFSKNFAKILQHEENLPNPRLSTLLNFAY